MALLHRAEMHPGKIELLAAWLPGRPWYRGEAGAELVRVAGFRFDDPAGKAGVETMLVRAGDGPVHQVPVTYREAPLEGADGWLIGTAEHSVLGRRWVYDACGDPVYAATLAAAILADTGQAELIMDVGGRLEPTVAISGSGTPGAAVPAVTAVRRVVDDEPTLVVTDAIELTVVRRPGTGDADRAAAGGTATLTATWPGQATPLPLAYASPS